MGDVVRGPWKPVPGRVDASQVRWRRGRPIDPHANRQHCAECARPFHPDAWVPVDKICAECQEERARAERDAVPPTLFDPDGGDDMP